MVSTAVRGLDAFARPEQTARIAEIMARYSFAYGDDGAAGTFVSGGD
jgi:hypothetical protein